MSSSDYSMISFIRSRSEIKSKIDAQISRSFKHFDKIKFLEELKGKDWETIMNETCVNKATELMTDFLTESLDKFAPIKLKQTRKNYCPVLTQETINLIKEREERFRTSQTHRTEENIRIWKDLRNKVVKYVKRDKENGIKKMLSNSKTAWQVANKVQKTKSSKGGPPSKLLINGNLCTNKKILANHMNNFFTNKVTNNRTAIHRQEPSYNPINFLEEKMDSDPPQLTLREITINELRNAIKKMKNTTSAGPDNIPSHILKYSAETIIKPTLHIINLSLNKGEFPKKWKIGKIIPLHKKKCPMMDKHYRPIALLSKLSLLLEQIVHTQIAEHFTNNKLFNERQHGYIKNKSCVTALTSMYDRWVTAANKGLYTGILCMDMQAAFDLVDTTILLNKLRKYGADNKTTNWIKTYLEEMEQFVNIGTANSNKNQLPCGVPQGSKLGPLLFNIYVNDLILSPKNGDMEVYADDSALTYCHRNPTTIIKKLKDDSANVTKWPINNKLLLSPEKTEFMLAASKGKIRNEEIENLKIKVGELRIRQSLYTKLLGVTFSRDLTFNLHLHGTHDKEEKGLIKELSNRIWALDTLRSNCTEETMRYLVNDIFMGKMLYAIQLWGGNKSTCKHLQLLQNRAARLITGKGRRTSKKDLLGQCKWLDITNTVTLQSINLLFNIRHFGTPKYIWDQVMNNRATLYMSIPEYDTNQIQILKDSFIPRTIRSWNALDEGTRRTPPSKFSCVLRKKLMSLQE